MRIGSSVLLSFLVLGGWIATAQAQTSSTSGGAGGGTGAATPTVPPPATLFLDAVNITATREEKSLKDTPASVVVIDKEEMETYLFNDIEELIRYTPGVTVDRGFGADPFKQLNGFNIRGVGGNRILTLVDGNRMAERITDGTRNYVDLAFMKSVEIVRGPSGVLWGSDAMGGTVSYETLDPYDLLGPGKDWSVNASARYGSLDQSYNETLTGAYRLGEVEFLIGYSRWDADQVELTKGRNVGGIWGDCGRPAQALDCDRIDPLDQGSNNLLAKAVWTGEGHRVSLTGEYYDQRVEVDQWSGRGVVSAGWRMDEYVQTQDLTRWRLSLEHAWEAGFVLFDKVDWQVTYHPQNVDIEGERHRTGVSGLVVGQEELFQRWRSYNEDFIDFDVQFDKSFNPFGERLVSGRLIYGIDGSNTTAAYVADDRTENLTTGAVTTSDSAGFFFANSDTLRLDGFAQLEIGFLDDRLIVTPGLRYSYTRITPDPQDSYGEVAGFEPTETSWSDWLLALSILYKVTDEVSVYAAYGEGFKTPTAQQLYTSVPGTSFDQVPNPDLKPESVKSYEIGARADLGWGAFSLTGFYSDYDDFIAGFQFVPGPDPMKLYITSLNLSSLKVFGVEASAEVEAYDDLYLRTALSWTKADQIPSEGADEIAWNSAQPFKAVNGIRYEAPGLGIGVELIHTFEAGFKRAAGEADLTTQNYHLFDVVASYQPYDWITLRAGVFNIFDQRYLPSAAVAAYSTPAVPSASVANGNPIEARIAPGINVTLSLSLQF